MSEHLFVERNKKKGAVFLDLKMEIKTIFNFKQHNTNV